MIVQDLLQFHFQILLIISQKKLSRLNAMIENVFFKSESVKDHLIKNKCLSCNKDYSNKIDEELKKRLITMSINLGVKERCLSL